MSQYDAHVQNLSIRWTLQIKVILFNNLYFLNLVAKIKLYGINLISAYAIRV